MVRQRTNEAISGTPSRFGRGTSSSTTAPSAAITSWTCASTARPTRLRPRRRSAQWLGASATSVTLTTIFDTSILTLYYSTPSTSTASHAGSRPAKCARSTIATGSFKSTVGRRIIIVRRQGCDSLQRGASGRTHMHLRWMTGAWVLQFEREARLPSLELSA